MSGPPLEEGEVVLFDHIPSHAAFRRTALVLLATAPWPERAAAPTETRRRTRTCCLP